MSDKQEKAQIVRNKLKENPKFFDPGNPKSCNCGRFYKTRKSFRQHKSQSSCGKEKNNQCDLCGNRFATQG